MQASDANKDAIYRGEDIVMRRNFALTTKLSWNIVSQDEDGM